MIRFVANTACASHNRPHRINDWYVCFERKTKLKCEMRYGKVCKVTVHLLKSHRSLRYDSELYWLQHVRIVRLRNVEWRRNKLFDRLENPECSRHSVWQLSESFSWYWHAENCLNWSEQCGGESMPRTRAILSVGVNINLGASKQSKVPPIDLDLDAVESARR